MNAKYSLPGIDVTTLRLQTFDDSKKKRVGLARHFEYDEEMARALQKSGAGLYWCLNPGERTVATTTHIARVALDLDVCKEGDNKTPEEVEIAKANLAVKLGDMEIPPSAIIETKNGLQPYWILDNPLPLANEEERKIFNSVDYKRLLQGLDKVIGIKNERPDICGVFRLPGSLHLKNPDQPFEIKVTGNGTPVDTKQFFETYMVPLESTDPERAQAADKLSTHTTDENSYLNVPIVDFLAKLSGDPIVNGEVYEFTANNKETLNIIINGKETGQWIDLKQNTIGSAKGGASVTIANWIAYYGVLDKDQAIAWLDKAMGKMTKQELDNAKDNMMERLKETKHEEAVANFQIESLVDLYHESMPPQRWLIKNMIPAEGVVMIDGAPATGKSFYSLTMAHSISTGSPWLNHFEVSQTTNVLIIDKENGRRRFQDRMKGLGMVGDNMWRIKQPEKFSFADAKGVLTDFAKFTVGFVDEHNIGLIVIDSMVDLMSGDENSAGDTQLFFNNIRSLYPHQTILVLHHEGKDDKNEKSKMNKSRGSSNIPGQADFIFRVQPVIGEPGTFQFEHAKSRDTAMMTPFTIRMITKPDPEDPERTMVTALQYGEEILDGDPKKLGAMEIIMAMLPDRDDMEFLLREDIVAECAVNDISEETTKDAIYELARRKILKSEPVGIKGYGNKKKFYKYPVRVSHLASENVSYKDD